jgi:hypothetical protein
MKSKRIALHGFLASIAAVAMMTSLVACGVSSFDRAGPASFTELNRCLEKHGVAHPENIPGPNQEERTLPSLIGVRGVRVPLGVTRVQFEGALRECGAGYLRVAPAPVTSPVLQGRVLRVTACLARNGFMLPPPNFHGPGPVLDTSSVNVASAKWVATVRGCQITRQQLTQTALSKCMDAKALEGNAGGNMTFEQQFLGLSRCLKRVMQQ